MSLCVHMYLSMYLCINVCMYACIYVRIYEACTVYMPLRHVHTRQVDYLTRVYITRTHMRTYDVHSSYIRVCVYIYIRIIHTCTHMRVYSHVCMHNIWSHRRALYAHERAVYTLNISLYYSCSYAPVCCAGQKRGSLREREEEGWSNQAWLTPLQILSGKGRGGVVEEGSQEGGGDRRREG